MNLRRNICCWAGLVGVAFGAWAGPRSDELVARIAFLSDTHVRPPTNEVGVAYDRRFDEAIAAANAARVDLVLIGGDLTDGGRLEQIELFKRKVKHFQAPVLFVAGNHDVGIVGNGETKTSITPERVKRFGKEMGPNWFSRQIHGVRIIGVNSCLFGSGFKEEADQCKFLERELAKPHLAPPTLLLQHYPLFINRANEPRNGTWNVEPELRKRLLALVEQGGVRAVLTGHLHYPITNRLDGILFLGNSPTAFGLPRGKQPEGWMLLTVLHPGEVRFEFHRLEQADGR